MRGCLRGLVGCVEAPGWYTMCVKKSYVDMAMRKGVEDVPGSLVPLLVQLPAVMGKTALRK